MIILLINLLIIPTRVSASTEAYQKIWTEQGSPLLVNCLALKEKLAEKLYSEFSEKEIFNSFCNGEGNHLATIKMMQSGITILPISLGIINYMSGNPEDSAQKICRFLGIEYDNLNKKAEIHIRCSKTDFEKKRIETALMFFDENKILKM